MGTQKEKQAQSAGQETSNPNVEKGFEMNIMDNYLELEKSIVNQLKLYNRNHPTTTGSLREDIWMQIFERIVPKKFVIERSIFIIDSYRGISKEVDLAIIDNTYTPYIFQYGRLKYVPIEAVAAVIECKSTKITLKEKGSDGKERNAGLKVWCESIQKLRTSMESVVRIATGAVIEGGNYAGEAGPKKPYSSTQTSTRPIRIFCGYETKIPNTDLVEIKENLFDFVLLASEKDGLDQIMITAKDRQSFQDWYNELNHYEFDKKQVIQKENEILQKTEIKQLENYHLEDLRVERGCKEISLLSFNFQLNQLLMLINNPILFPHLAYAKMFNGEQRRWEK